MDKIETLVKADQIPEYGEANLDSDNKLSVGTVARQATSRRIAES